MTVFSIIMWFDRSKQGFGDLSIDDQNDSSVKRITNWLNEIIPMDCRCSYLSLNCEIENDHFHK